MMQSAQACRIGWPAPTVAPAPKEGQLVLLPGQLLRAYHVQPRTQLPFVHFGVLKGSGLHQLTVKGVQRLAPKGLYWTPDGRKTDACSLRLTTERAVFAVFRPVKPLGCKPLQTFETGEQLKRRCKRSLFVAADEPSAHNSSSSSPPQPTARCHPPVRHEAHDCNHPPRRPLGGRGRHPFPRRLRPRYRGPPGEDRLGEIKLQGAP